jgi:DNA-binding HxlR family transcriptional regulator/putative sterol carrier protein
MKGKCYDQVPYCPMAHALSLVGERWSLLIVRELLHGPRRYTDLANGLPGIGTNILAARLKDLETFGVVEKKKLPPPYASTVYELTPYGRELDEVLYALGRWGARSLGPPVFEEELYPEWGLNALPALFDPEAARDLDERYVLKIGDDVFTADVHDGRLGTEVGESSDRDLVAEMDMPTLWALTSGELSPAEALKAGRVRIEGDAEALERCFKVFHMAPRTVAA